jgi:hypothetical protein
LSLFGISRFVNTIVFIRWRKIYGQDRLFDWKVLIKKTCKACVVTFLDLTQRSLISSDR